MNLRSVRRIVTSLAVAGLLTALAVPASAGKLDEIDANSVPPMIDLALLRPIGLATTIAGAAAFIPAALVTAIFSPSQVDETFDVLVRGPYEYTFVDPIGTH